MDLVFTLVFRPMIMPEIQIIWLFNFVQTLNSIVYILAYLWNLVKNLIIPYSNASALTA